MSFCNCPSFQPNFSYTNLASGNLNYCYDSQTGAVITHSGSAYKTWWADASASFNSANWTLVENCSLSSSSSSPLSSSSFYTQIPDTIYIQPSAKFEQYEFYLGFAFGFFIIYAISKMI